MLLLGLYLFIALFFSFLCSVAEAVLLSISRVHIALMEKEGHKAGQILRQLKEDINKPLTAILTINTVAHTVGATGIGAQATVVFGSAYMGIVSAVLTLLILVFSEIIPKTLGASYWKALAPVTAYCLKYMVLICHPFIKMSQLIVRHLINKNETVGFGRNELAVMAKLSAQEGHIDPDEAMILHNLFEFKNRKIMDAITPRAVMFSDSQDLQVGQFFHKHQKVRFSRIPVYDKDPDNITGYVIRTDLLLAQARGNTDSPLSNYLRKMPTLLDTMSLSHAMKEIATGKNHLSLVVNEYGTLRGILTLEDILESLIGREIVDEQDKYTDMQKQASRDFKARTSKKPAVITRNK